MPLKLNNRLEVLSDWAFEFTDIVEEDSDTV